MSALLEPFVGAAGLVILLVALALVVARGVLHELGPDSRAAGWSKPLGLTTVVLVLLGLAVTVARLARYRW